MAQPSHTQNFGFTLEQVSCVCEVLQVEADAIIVERRVKYF